MYEAPVEGQFLFFFYVSGSCDAAAIAAAYWLCMFTVLPPSLFTFILGSNDKFIEIAQFLFFPTLMLTLIRWDLRNDCLRWHAYMIRFENRQSHVRISVTKIIGAIFSIAICVGLNFKTYKWFWDGQKKEFFNNFIFITNSTFNFFAKSFKFFISTI